MGRTLREDARLEAKLRLLPKLKKDSEFHPKTQFHLFSLQAPVLGWDDEWEPTPVEHLFTHATTTTTDSTPRGYVVAGQLGSGRTTLARAVLSSWLTADRSILGLERFEGVFVIGGEDLCHDQTLPLILSVFPDTISHWGLDGFLQWIEEAKILLFIDDFSPDEGAEKVTDLLREWRRSEPVLLIDTLNIPKVIRLLDPLRPVTFRRFQKLGLDMQNAIADFVIREKYPSMGEEVKSVFSVYKDLNPIFDVFSGIEFYLKCASMFELERAKSPVSSFIWGLIYQIYNDFISKKSLPLEKVKEWFLMVGEHCHKCLARRDHLQGEIVPPLFQETRFIFPNSPDTYELVEILMSCHYSLYNDGVLYSIAHQKLEEFLTAFYLLKENLEGMPLKRMIKKLKNDDEVVTFVGGLLAIFYNEEEKSFQVLSNSDQRKTKKVERVLKNLSYHQERASDPTAFIFKVIHELQCHSVLTESFLRDEVFAPYLHLHDEGIYADAMSQVFKRSPLNKIHLLVRKRHYCPEIQETLRFIKVFKVNLAFANMNQVEWRSDLRTSDVLNNLNEDSSITVQDFIGCLDKEDILQLPNRPSTKDLVCLRVRVCEVDAAKALLDVHSRLPSLIWFEMDFDFEFDQFIDCEFPAIVAPLIDLNFRDITDDRIGKFCDFIRRLTPRLSGLHVHQSSVSPQGVIEVLKYFFRRDMTLHGDPKDVSKYRKYRFPEFSVVDPRTELTDEETERLLGYDDRHHYCDNEVQSSCSATLVDVNALKNFFVLMKIRNFLYSCSTFCLRKEEGEWVVQKTIPYSL